MRNINRKVLAAATIPALMVLFAGIPAHAAEGPSGTYVQAAYVDWDDADNGFNVAGSFMATPELRIFAAYTDTDLEHLQVGAGWIFPLENDVSIEVGGSYHNLDAGPVDDDGLGVHGVVRFLPMPELTLSGKLEYVFLDDFDNETIFGIDADWRVIDDFSVFGSFDIYDEIDNNQVKLGARLRF